MSLQVPLLLLALHFLGDFILQSDWMALGKSKRFEVLLAHCFVYSLCFVNLYGVRFFLLTFLLHLGVDFCTSRLTSRLWFIDLKEIRSETKFPWKYCANVNMRKRHWFFVAIGADQLLHFVCLAGTLKFLGG